MNIPESNFQKTAEQYMLKLKSSFTSDIYKSIEILSKELEIAWTNKKNIFICGNGGSAANAIHIANDLHYGVGTGEKNHIKPGMKVEALSANNAIITCLANDTGYENIYANQIKVKGSEDDMLIALSGSGNSPNIIRAIEQSNLIRMRSFAILAFDGGKCKNIAEHSIHFEVNDMQIAEDAQLITGHLCMQWLKVNNKLKFRETDG